MTDLVELLEQAHLNSGGAPPTVADLRGILTRRRRRQRRRQIATGGVAALALTATIGLAVRASRPTGESLLAIVDPTPADDGVALANGTVEAEWSALLPVGNWSPGWLVSTAIGVDEFTVDRRLWLVDPAQGPYGPVALIIYNPGVETAGYLDGLAVYDEVALDDGRTARIGATGGTSSLSAYVDVEGGSIELVGLEIERGALLDLLSNVEVADGEVRIASGAVPAGLEAARPPAIDHGLRTLVLLRDDEGAEVQVEIVPLDDWARVLTTRAAFPGAEVVETELGRVVRHPASGTTDAGFVLATGDATYAFGGGYLAPAGTGISGTDAGTVDDPIVDSPDIGAATVPPTDVDAILDSLEVWTATELADELGLQPREEVVERWLVDTPLPAGTDLGWLADGPPLSPEDEAANVHLWFGCSWIDAWIDSGDPSDLLALDREASWPTGRLLDARTDSLANDETFPVHFFAETSSESSLAAGSAATRADSELRQHCSEPLGTD